MKITKVFTYLIDGIDPVTEVRFSQGDPLLDKAVKQRLREIRNELIEKGEDRKAVRNGAIVYNADIEKLSNIIVEPDIDFYAFVKSIAYSTNATRKDNGKSSVVKPKPSHIRQRIYDYLLSIGAVVEQKNMNDRTFYSTTKYGEDLGILVEEDIRHTGGLIKSISSTLQRKLIEKLPEILNPDE